MTLTNLPPRALRRFVLAQPPALGVIDNDGTEHGFKLIGATDPNAAQYQHEKILPEGQRTLDHTTTIDPRLVFYRDDSGNLMTLAEIVARYDDEVSPSINLAGEPKEILTFLREAYSSYFSHVHLGYADYRDSCDDNPSLLTTILHGENPYETEEGEELWFGVSTNEGSAAAELVEELNKEVEADLNTLGITADLLDDPLYTELYEDFRDLDESDAFGDIVKNSDPFFIQITPEVTDENPINLNSGEFAEMMKLDDTTAFDALTAHMRALGLPASGTNAQIVHDALTEAFYPGEWIELTIFGRVEIDPFYDDMASDLVKLSGFHVWVGNLYSGSGCETAEPLRGSITVPRKLLFHDKSAGNHVSIDEICGFAHSFFTPMEVTLSSSVVNEEDKTIEN